MTRSLPFAIALLSAAFMTGAVAAAEPVKAEPATPPYVHAVVFRLKKDAPKDEVDKVIADCHDLLEKIPTVRALHVGRPAAEDKSTPKVATRDYDVALVIFFDDFEGLKTYLEHEKHLKFVEIHGKNFEAEKLQVFDFMNEKK